MTMIEKVANSIRDSFNSNDVDCYPLAKAAIKAMRHPTKEMIIAGWSCFNTKLELPLTRYRAMIEAALNEMPSSQD
jgi:hypothetical protein